MNPCQHPRSSLFAAPAPPSEHNHARYDSLGKLTASTGSLVNPFQYTAREFDPETGLYYYRARYYDSSVGRFLSEDRLRFQGGANFYRYVQNSSYVQNSLSVWIDPSGDNLCYSVTPNGMVEKPCADPQGGMSCLYVPGGVSCHVPIPPGPPRPALSSASTRTSTFSRQPRTVCARQSIDGEAVARAEPAMADGELGFRGRGPPGT
ncbi:MAG: RHS repeat-associated core domain-containing protein [Candidatus Acidiferrales bacterium]